MAHSMDRMMEETTGLVMEGRIVGILQGKCIGIYGVIAFLIEQVQMMI